MAQGSYEYVFHTILLGYDGYSEIKLLFKIRDEDFIEKRIEIDGKIIQLCIWYLKDDVDLSSWLTPKQYYRNFKGFLLTYDITSHESFENVCSLWRTINNEYADLDAEVMLIGSNCQKKDEREVPTEKAAKFADEFGMKFMEVSTEEDHNIDKAFFTFASGVLRRFPKHEKEIPEQQPSLTKRFINSVRKFVGFESKNVTIFLTG
nr:ras-related protein Rab-10-like [Pocillopora verrucosa]